MLLAMAIATSLASGLTPSLEQAPTTSPSASTTRPAQALTLAEALARARARSPLIEAARTRQRASVLARSAVPWLPNPVIELRGENYGPATGLLQRDVFATVSQPVEIGGDRRARVADAGAMAGLADAELHSAERMAAVDVVERYVGALRARDVMSTLVEQREGVAELVATLGARVREGVSAEADLRKFETEHTRLASQVTRASIALQSALQQLAVAIGQEVRAELLEYPILPTPPAAAPEPDAGIANRADVQTAMARLQRAEATLSLERARRIPDLAVTAGYKRTAGADTGVVGVTMGVPLFDRNRVGVAHATGSVSAARLDLQYVRQQAAADVRTRWAAARELGEQAARIDRDLVEPAGVVRAAARSAFVEGRGDVLQLVDAERVYGDATREALELRLDAALAIIHARLAIGDSPLP